jgi:serine/threonine-protein phosphatase 2A regulatory subunit A
MGDQSALNLFIEDINNDEVFVRVNAIHRLKVVCTLLGPEQIRNQLLPKLKELVNSYQVQDDEVLFAIADELGSLQPFLTEAATQLIPPLETLATLEETVVRDQAVKSLIKLAGRLTDSEVTTHFAPMVLRLATTEPFTSRVSACGLFSSAYARAGSQKDKLRQRFLELCHEDTPMVRRSTALNAGKLCEVMEKDVLLTEVLPVFRQLSQDDQDPVRVLCLDSLVKIAKILSKEDNRVHTVPVCLAAGEDKSWKVRLHFAQNFPQLAEAYGRDITESSLVQTFTQLLKDIEPEVKAAALISLGPVLRILSQDKIISLIYPAVAALVQDASSSHTVLRSAADVIAELAEAVGRDFTSSRLLPLEIELLKDDHPEVKLHVLKRLSRISSIVGPDVLSPALLTSLQIIARDCTNWRVREAVYQVVGEFGQQFGSEAFVMHLQGIFFGFFNDSVSGVRESGVEALGTLSLALQGDWVNANLLPKLRDIFFNEHGYIGRITVVKAVSRAPIHNDNLMEFITAAAKDLVPNVRFILCKQVLHLADRVEKSSLRGLLQEMTTDVDKDVRYYAKEALAGLS